jgi:hemerythrin-like domain-containing protein
MRSRVGRILREHREIATLARQLADEVRQVALDFQVPRDRFVETADAYVAVNRRHMREEEADLFPAAEKLLSPGDWAEIEAETARQADPIFGLLEDRYLSLHQRILQLSD